MAQRKLIFQLKADYDPKDLISVRLQQRYAYNVQSKRGVPTMDGVSIKATLYCIREFQEEAISLNFDTGPELFDNFRRILRGAAKDDWDSVIATIPARTDVSFNQALENWKSEMILPTAILNDNLATYGYSNPFQILNGRFAYQRSNYVT
jgi:hypothetical protein